MDCQHARDWLLGAEDPTDAADAPPALVRHLGGCGGCRRLADRLAELEGRYRAEMQPVPAPVLRAFRARGQGRAACPRRALPRWLMAAAVLLAAGATLWFLPAAQQAHASDVVGRLIDWNLALSQSRTPDERNRIYAERADELKTALEAADLPPADRELGDALIESGSRMAARADPTAEADHFNQVAERLLAQLDRATTKKDARRIRLLSDFYARVAERGVLANVERAEASGALNFRKQKRLEKVLLRDAAQAEKLARLLERAPNASRKEIRRALDLRKNARQKKAAKKAKKQDN
jgi:hypothetical protein